MWPMPFVSASLVTVEVDAFNCVAGLYNSRNLGDVISLGTVQAL